MFQNLTDRFHIFRRKVLGYGRITKSEIDTILKELRITLLEADVHYQVVKEFIENINKKALNQNLDKRLSPGELIMKIVFEELVELLGKSPRYINFRTNGPTIISLLGLQGVGKTTTAAKIAYRFSNKKPLLVPADAKRPAAVEQLTQLGKRNNIPVFSLQNNDPVLTAKLAKETAEKQGFGLLIIDTAGRLHIDDELVDELVQIHNTVKPDYKILVADGMTGQDAVNQAKAFKEKVGLDGVILTKLDGDARGGAALSIARISGVPIYYIGISENVDGLEEFHPDRIAQRILGMGDVVSLVEKVKTIERDIDQAHLQRKIVRGELNLEDFLEQLRALKRLGPLSRLVEMLPGVNESDVDEREFKKIEAIINSMTVKERQHPEIIDGSRRRRIALGSGTTVADVNQLLKQFFYARDLLKKMAQGKLPGRIPFRLK
ncbi:MAG: signal recognition particle protein [candidate division WOR-3 bacterium]|nr:signal recognition particle protein [candidate division WOR-3 bacterium]